MNEIRICTSRTCRTKRESDALLHHPGHTVFIDGQQYWFCSHKCAEFWIKLTGWDHKV